MRVVGGSLHAQFIASPFPYYFLQLTIEQYLAVRGSQSVARSVSTEAAREVNKNKGQARDGRRMIGELDFTFVLRVSLTPS